MARIGRYVAGSLVVGYGALQILGRQAGSTAEELLSRMPGDELVARPQITNHAITIEARPADVWPWLTQLGWHLGGYYTPEWVNRLLFPQNWPSLNHLDPALMRDLSVGDTIPDGPPGTAPARRTARRRNSAAAASPGPNGSVVADGYLRGHDHPRRLRHGRRDAARDQATRRIRCSAEVVRQVTTGCLGFNLVVYRG